MYQSKITEIGSMVDELMEAGMLIVFNDDAPDALREMSVLHTIEELVHPVKVDDIVVFGNKEFLVTAVGYEANETLKTMGHCTFCFNGADKVEIPGQIELLGEEKPVVEVGFDFHIYST
ncbi:MAG: PTS glucitol/sorbitol transporter subunit IIA [Eubacteriaceae bacterium]